MSVSGAGGGRQGAEGQDSAAGHQEVPAPSSPEDIIGDAPGGHCSCPATPEISCMSLPEIAVEPGCLEHSCVCVEGGWGETGGERQSCLTARRLGAASPPPRSPSLSPLFLQGICLGSVPTVRRAPPLTCLPPPTPHPQLSPCPSAPLAGSAPCLVRRPGQPCWHPGS